MNDTRKKEVRKLAWLLCITYVVSYITRISYGVIIAEMETALQVSKVLLSISLTVGLITYGAGQILSGFVSDKLSPKALITAGLIVTTLMNLLIPIFPNPYAMIFIWGINGLAQAFMWPPIVKIMLSLLNKQEYEDAMVVVIWGSSVGTIIVYLVSPLLISLLSWEFVFVFSALCGTLMAIFWHKLCPTVDAKTPSTARIETNTCDCSTTMKTPFVLLGVIMVAICCHGMLRDGVATWMPSYIKESFSLSNEISILTGVILPVFAIISIRIAHLIYKKISNPLTTAAVFFSVATFASLLLAIFPDKSPAVSIALSAIITGCMHGTNVMLVCMIPNFFDKNGKESLYSGMLNSATYVGSASFTYGIAYLAEIFDWRIVIGIWAMIALIGAILCLICIKPFYKRYVEKH